MDAPSPAASSGAPSEPTTDFKALGGRHLSPVLGRYFERSWSRGEGHRLYDSDGNRYLDFALGIATSALGHAHPKVTAAIHAQVDRIIQPTNAIGYAEPVSRLSRLLADASPAPLDTVFFGNSGAEAIEGAIKLARRVTGRPGIIAFTGGFHGRTLGAASVTSSNINYRTGYEPLLPSVYISQFPDAYREYAGDPEAATAGAIRELRTLTTTIIPPRAIAGILIEPVQGEGGFNPAPLAFLQFLRSFCDEHGILLIMDEVQSGYGRTGRFWAFEHAGIVPDVVCSAKAIANGLPLSAIISRRELQERWGVGAHGTTYGGNPVACAAGVAVLETIRDERLVENAEARGAQLRAGLRVLWEQDERIGDVRGPGMMIGVEFVRDRATREPDGSTVDALLQRCADLGLLVLSCGRHHNVIRWIPPLDVTPEEIDEGLDLFASALESVPIGAGEI